MRRSKRRIVVALLPIVFLAAGGNRAAALSADTEKSAATKAGAPAAPANSSEASLSAPDSEMDRLLSILVRKHLLSKEEAANVRAEVKKEEEAPSASAPRSSQTQLEAQSEADAAQPVATAESSSYKEGEQERTLKLPFSIGGYAEMQWASLPESGSTFQVRRARISIDGDIRKIASYKIQVEALNSPSLLDAYLVLKPVPHATMTFGQFKIPFSQENLRSSSDLLTVERSQVVNGLAPGRDIGSQGRDIGAQISGSLNFSDSTGVDYAAGVFNGAGINRKDDNNSKDIVTRLSVRPFQGLALAGDYYRGASGPTEIARDRQGAEIAYMHAPVTLQSEFIWGRDGAIHEQGWYGLAAWRFSKSWEAVFRVDGFDPDRSKRVNSATSYLGGYNWYFAPHLKWQLNEGLENTQRKTKNLFLSQLQFQF